MSDEARNTILDEKLSRIIAALSELYNLSLDRAAEIFYNSETSQLIIEGVADLHCRSSKYLAQLIWDEHNEGK